MRERLARVTGQVVAAADRRRGEAGPSGEAIDRVVRVLQSDYGDWMKFADADALPDDDYLARLADVFGLDGMGADLLAVAAAPEIDANFAQAYELLGGRPGSGWPSVGTTLELCGVPTASAAASEYLHPAGRLRRMRLLDVVGESSWLLRSVHVADRVRAFLCGDHAAEPAVLAIAVDAVPFPCPAAALVAQALQAGEQLIWIRSPLGTAGVSVAVAGFAAAGADCLVVDARMVPDRAGLPDILGEAAREAGLRAVGLVVTGAEAITEQDASRSLRVLAASPVPVGVVGGGAWQSGWLASIPLTVDAPFLTAEDRAGIWAQTLGVEVRDEPGHVALSSLRLTPEEILTASRYARTLAETRQEDVTAAAVRDAVRVTTSSASAGVVLGQVATPANRLPTTFDDLVLSERTAADLHRLVRWAGYRDEILARGSLHGKGGKGSGIAALFTGGPGTGKTLAAHVVADELNLELMQVDLSSVVDKYIGETEKNLERIFHEAESRNVVLFFDEADALFGSRSAVQDAHDRYANQEVSYLLQRMEHFDGITVLATNLRGNLDQAFSRRMQFIVHFSDPDAATRRRLWQQHLDQAGGISKDDPVDLDVLAESVELAGGDIRNIVLAAAYDAACEGRLVGQEYLRVAAIREYQKLGRRAPVVLG